MRQIKPREKIFRLGVVAVWLLVVALHLWVIVHDPEVSGFFLNHIHALYVDLLSLSKKLHEIWAHF